MKVHLSEWGIVSIRQAGMKFTLRLSLYDPDYNLKVTTWISEYFSKFSIPHTISAIRNMIVCEWEIRK
jgi:hypothetical protein